MATNNPFRKKDIPAALKSEILNRQGKTGMEWTAERFPWIKVTSMSSACDNKYTVLTSLSGDLYTKGYDRPLPVINGLDVKKQGELGTTRRATLKLTAFTDNQLIDLQKCYFIPGMSVRVEWGWTTSAAGTSVTSPISGREISDVEAVNIMRNHTKTHPNYEGLQGIVSNFSYTLDANNFWECSIDIISAAEAFSTTPLDNQQCPDCITKEKSKENEDEVLEKTSPLFVMCKDLFKDFEASKPTYTSALGVPSEAIVQGGFNSAVRNEYGEDDAGFFGSIVEGIIDLIPSAVQNATNIHKSTKEPFITWSAFEKAINKYVAQGNSSKLYGKVKSDNIRLRYFECENCYGTQQNCDGSIVCGDHAWVTSADPRVCVLPGTNNSLVRFTERHISCLVEEGGKKYVLLDNMLINVCFLSVELRRFLKEDKPTLADFLTSVLSKINEACGGLWAFEVVDSSADGNEKYPVLSIIDTSIHQASDSVFEVPALPANSVVRELKLDMKLTESMKTQALYSNSNRITPSAKSPSGGGCGTNAMKGFRLYGKDVIKNLAKKDSYEDTNCEQCKECKKSKEASTEKAPTFEELVRKTGLDVTNTTTQSLKSALVAAYASAAGFGLDSHCEGIILPFTFSFTLDGIGGFIFGQMVSCDRIPSSIRTAYEFQVTTVEHNITPHDWTTTVTTIPRYKATNKGTKLSCTAKPAEPETANNRIDQQRVRAIIGSAQAYKVNEQGVVVGTEIGE